MDVSEYDQRPIVVAIAGPNGAGKTTFFHSHLAAAGMRFVNADVLARVAETVGTSKTLTEGKR
jgi:predicted ABC-type ATPase